MSALKGSCVVATLILAACGPGQIIHLVCREWDWEKHNVIGPPQAIRVDLGGGLISTPVGGFKINKVSDDTIVFGGDDPEKQFKVEGSLSRENGDVYMTYRRPNGAPVKLVHYTNCELRKRLF